MVGRSVAWILLLLALIAAGHDGLIYLKTGAYSPTEIGALWYTIDRGSLNLVQAVIERYIHPFLWQDVIFPLLVWPAWLVLIGLAVILGILSGRRRRKRKSGFG
ncbi:MAG TPA: hypothetical protein VGB82_28470 [Alphaproteobacteria bacterium]